jgi:hypothetical protein
MHINKKSKGNSLQRHGDTPFYSLRVKGKNFKKLKEEKQTKVTDDTILTFNTSI